MSERKQARAMDLPDYPCPPSVEHIAAHAGSWGWLNSNGALAQDEDGYLWIKSNASLTPQPNTGIDTLAAWTEEGVSVYVPRSAYQYVYTIRGAMVQAAWTPVASVMKEPPAYATSFAK